MSARFNAWLVFLFALVFLSMRISLEIVYAVNVEVQANFIPIGVK
jgi:hypothetical protein